jgi:peptidoglycan/LPS O-acetylase OafA/YrhL
LGSDRPPAHTLAGTFSARSNSLAMMRLGLAALVAVTHALAIGFGWQPHLGRTAWADLAVDGFFVLSGFLVTRSYLRLDSAGRYAWHRFLRLMPGFWACLLVTALVAAPLAAIFVGRSPMSVFTSADDPAWRYPLVNAALPILQFDIAGITSDSGETVFDGSLWTLMYEAVCYVAVAALGLATVLRRRAWLVPVACVVVWVGLLCDFAGLIPIDVPLLANKELLRFLLVFLLGAAACVFAHRVPIRWTWAALSGVGVVAGAFLPDYRLVAAVPFAYLCVYGMVRLPLRWTPAWDLSYGLYVYHWPVQFLMLLAGATVLGQAGFVALSVALGLLLAAVSWVVVEGPALRRKDARPPAVLTRRGSR